MILFLDNLYFSYTSLIGHNIGYPFIEGPYERLSKDKAITSTSAPNRL